MKLEKIQNKYLFILALMFLCQGLIVLMNWFIYYSYGNDELFISLGKIIVYFFLTMTTAIALTNIYFLSILCKNKSGKIIINIIATIFAIILYITTTMLQIVYMPVYKAPNYVSYSQNNYRTEVLENYKYMKPTYFPDEIPKNAKNYCCFSYLHLNFLRFNTDTQYLDDTISKNKDKIDKIMNMKEFKENYLYAYNMFKPYFSIKDSDKYQVYLFKQSLYRNFKYYGGFITLKETGEIIFFNLDEKAYYIDDLNKELLKGFPQP